ncbi:hypothetical protein NDS46_30495 (plasmid) [Paenibacillus thiaminolyticus]|uniref:hypothetical protein n=1 Tax=Paenibacillus thiaminolyticus TaxID=49283 RepID=UPI00232C13A2|nr:hypothetical protein [Paenibacillus thiaminolyticus]WCF11679.1 hypothetical protein NDS46_30495 [Paenibacillus thiaminolyticus]
MEICPKIKDLSTYKEVMLLSEEKGIPIQFSLGNKDMENLGETSGSRRGILIVINPEAYENEVVYIHELLHAKYHLLEYPIASFYAKIEFPQTILAWVASLHNSIQHTFIYKEMKKIGVEQVEINKDFATSILESARTNTADTRHMVNAMNFFEYYLRFPNAIDVLKKDKQIYPSEGFDLFLEMLTVIEKPLTTHSDFRNAYIKMFRIIDAYLLKNINMSMNLNHYICVDPVFSSDELNDVASKHLQVIDYPQCEHYFIIDKKDGQCSFFISKNKGKFNREMVNTYLNNSLIHEWMQYI